MASRNIRTGKRVLVRWTDDLDKGVLLTIQYACAEAGIKIPWPRVAELMGPEFTGGAIIQHLSKLRSKMEENNIPVPPPLRRGMVTKEPSKIYGTPQKRQISDVHQATSTPTKPKNRKKIKRDMSEDEDDNIAMPDLYDDSDDNSSPRKKQKKGKKKSEYSPSGPNAEDHKYGSDADNSDAEIDIQPKQQSQPSVEAEGSALRTRGLKRDYSKIDGEGSDEYDDDEGLDLKVEHSSEEYTPVHEGTAVGSPVSSTASEVIRNVNEDQSEDTISPEITDSKVEDSATLLNNNSVNFPIPTPANTLASPNWQDGYGGMPPNYAPYPNFAYGNFPFNPMSMMMNTNGQFQQFPPYMNMGPPGRYYDPSVVSSSFASSRISSPPLAVNMAPLSNFNAIRDGSVQPADTTFGLLANFQDRPMNETHFEDALHDQDLNVGNEESMFDDVLDFD